MKNGFRQSMAWLHTWTGLVVGWVLFFVFVTGNLGRFDTEIDRWMKPEMPKETASLTQAVGAAQERLQQRAANAESWTIWPATNRDYPNLRIRWEAQPAQKVDGSVVKQEGRERRVEETLNPETAKPVETRATGGGQLLYKMHYALHYLPRNVSEWLIGICSMFMLVAIISGIVTHKKIFADFFTFRPNKGQRSWLDVHAALATITLPFFLMITYSGLLFFVFTLFPYSLNSQYGEGRDARETFTNELNEREFSEHASGTAASLTSLSTLAAIAETRWGANQIRVIEVSNPNDVNARVRFTHVLDSTSRSSEELVFDGVSGNLLGERAAEGSNSRGFYDHTLGLHRGLFGGWVLRWLYFISGIAGAIIIASGLVLWVVKRNPKQIKQPNGPDFGHRLVQVLNVGTIAGLPIAIAAYFLANRLLPIDLVGRVNWEVNSLFIVWLAALLYPLARPLNRAWIELFWAAAIAFVLIPFVNAFTTDRGFISSVQAQDWIFISFDLVAITVSLLFAYGAIKLTRRENAEPLAKPNRRDHKPASQTPDVQSPDVEVA